MINHTLLKNYSPFKLAAEIDRIHDIIRDRRGGCLPKTLNFELNPIDLRIRKGRKASHGRGLPHPVVPAKNSIWKIMPGCSGIGACKSSDFFQGSDVY